MGRRGKWCADGSAAFGYEVTGGFDLLAGRQMDVRAEGNAFLRQARQMARQGDQPLMVGGHDPLASLDVDRYLVPVLPVQRQPASRVEGASTSMSHCINVTARLIDIDAPVLDDLHLVRPSRVRRQFSSILGPVRKILLFG